MSDHQWPTIDVHILCHGLIWSLGAEICFPTTLSAEDPILWTNNTDSESRFSRFIRAITSFRCSWSWRPKHGKNGFWLEESTPKGACCIKDAYVAHYHWHRIYSHVVQVADLPGYWIINITEWVKLQKEKRKNNIIKNYNPSNLHFMEYLAFSCKTHSRDLHIYLDWADVHKKKTH